MNRKWWIVGGLVFLELLVCGGILLTLWAGRAVFERVRLFYVADTHVEETMEETFLVDGPAVLDLEAISGNVAVTGGEGDEVQVTARLSLWGADEEDARRQVNVRMAQDGNRITVRVVRPQTIYAFASTRGSRVDFEIRVPHETALQLATSSGDLAVSEVTGSVELRTVSGSIRGEEVNGAVSARSSSGDVTLVGLSDGGDMEVRAVSGDVALRDVAADSLVAHTSSGKIQVAGGALSGGLDLESVSGRVTAEGVRAASYRLHSSSGDLTLDGCTGPLDLRTVSGGIEVRDGTEAELGIETSSGEVRFAGSLRARGNHWIKSVSGGVHLALPADAAFDLDVETVSGAIETDFAVTMTQFDRNHVAGEVNGGGPSLRIDTSSGNITLERATGGSD